MAEMWQFGTSVFNKVVQWRRLGEVENVAYNFGHFAIYLSKFIKIGGNFDEVVTKSKMHHFLETRGK